MIDKLYTQAIGLNMAFNTSKIVCMVFNPVSCKVVSKSFHVFAAGNTELRFVKEFKYLGSVISDTLKDDCYNERKCDCLYCAIF